MIVIRPGIMLWFEFYSESQIHVWDPRSVNKWLWVFFTVLETDLCLRRFSSSKCTSHLKWQKWLQLGPSATTEESLENIQYIQQCSVLNSIFPSFTAFGVKSVLHYYIIMISEADSERSMPFQEQSKNSKFIAWLQFSPDSSSLYYLCQICPVMM